MGQGFGYGAIIELTERERETLALIAQHITNPELAERLSLSQKTVRNHVSNIFSTLQVVDRAQAIMRARPGSAIISVSGIAMAPCAVGIVVAAATQDHRDVVPGGPLCACEP